MEHQLETQQKQNPFEMEKPLPETEKQPQSEHHREKRYFWIKLKEGFFDDIHIKALKAQLNGYRMVVIYLSMQLKALKTDGMLEYRELLPDYTDELALMLGESSESIAEAINELERVGLIELWDNKTVYLTAKQEIIEAGNEGASAERVRRCRERKKALQCNSGVTDT